MLNEPVVLKDVTFSYRRRPVLTGVSWHIDRGVTALLGPNGSGKTTLIKCLVGLLRVSGGDIRICGRSIRDGASTQRLVGYVPQEPMLPGLARVRDVVEYAAWLSEIPAQETDRRVTSALKSMGVLDLGPRRIRSLSGGQRQRVALAAGVVHDPAVLILDEPTVGLDPGQRLKVRGVIGEIGRSRPVLLSTHLTEDVQHLASSVGVLVGGSIRFDGSVEELSRTIEARSTPDDRPGSAFERAYDDLMLEYGGHE